MRGGARKGCEFQNQRPLLWCLLTLGERGGWVEGWVFVFTYFALGALIPG